MGTSHEALVTLGFIIPEEKLIDLVNILYKKKLKKLSESDVDELRETAEELLAENKLAQYFQSTLCRFGYGVNSETGMVISFLGDFNPGNRGYSATAWGRDDVTPAALELPELNEDEADVWASEEMIQKLQETFHLKQLGVEVEKKWILRVECSS